MAKRSLPRLAACLVLMLAGLGARDAQASTYRVLQPIGGGPSGLLRDPSGMLYGTTEALGNSRGTVFSLSPDTNQLLFIYSFCPQFITCPDGAFPLAGVIEDEQGNLYGTASGGGTATGGGTIFKLTFDHVGKSWSESVLYSFCLTSACPDGSHPNSKLTYRDAASGAPYDGVSPLYGVTNGGGSKGYGAVFEFTPGAGGTWTEKVIYNVCPDGSCADGEAPSGGLTMDGAGNLFLNTQAGGIAASGTVIELTHSGRTWTPARIYEFCSVKKCRDGQLPLGALLIDAAGRVLGTTMFGGQRNAGVVFALTPAKHEWKEHVLYSFCAEKMRRCVDGAQPVGGVVMDSAGDLLGVASTGGTHLKGGTVFSLSGGTFQVLHAFCQHSNQCDGYRPVGTLTLDPSGDIFGVTTGFGKYDGSIYEISP